MSQRRDPLGMGLTIKGEGGAVNLGEDAHSPQQRAHSERIVRSSRILPRFHLFRWFG
jgi:hypothetical protein